MSFDRLELNPVPEAVGNAVAELFPDDPPAYMERGPFSYVDPALIEHDLVAAGFSHIKLETVALTSRVSARDAAKGMVLIGMSHGGVTALLFALGSPHRVRTLTLVEPPAFWVLPNHGHGRSFELSGGHNSPASSPDYFVEAWQSFQSEKRRTCESAPTSEDTQWVNGFPGAASSMRPRQVPPAPSPSATRIWD